MARETHSPSSETSAPGVSPRRRGEASARHRPRLFGDPSRGAAASAPTAPHATAGEGQGEAKTGPARFWRGRGVRVAVAIAFSLSLVVHWLVTPWTLLPASTGIEFKDPADELSIPVDLLGAEEPPPPPAPPSPVTADQAQAEKDALAPGRADAGPKPARDAGAKLASAFDAGGAEEADGGSEPSDAGATTDASALEAGSARDGGGLVAAADAAAGPGTGGPRDPESMFGLSKVVNAGVQNVVLGVNVALIRKHPVGARMGPILQALPQWKDFLRGAPAPVDPIRDTDWILVYGPSLINTDKDAVLVRYNVPDEAVDMTIGAIARTYDKGGPYDAGVPGVKSSLGFADNAQRVFLRPQSKLLVIVPPSHAHEAALTFRRQAPRGPPANEAMRLIVHNPSNQISIPGLKFPTALNEIRFWIVPRGDGGADVHGEGDCESEDAAVDAAERLTEVLKRTNGLGVRFATRGLLNNAVVVADGKHIRLHVLATPEQLEAVLQIAAATVNAQLAPPTGAVLGHPSPPAATPHRE